jgi:hypothetical protein
MSPILGNRPFFIIIISLLQSTGHRPLQFLVGYSHPVSASRSAQIVTSPGLSPTLRLPRRGLHSRTRLPQRLSVLWLIWPPPLQHANTVCYVGDFSSLSDQYFRTFLLELSYVIPIKRTEHTPPRWSSEGNAKHYKWTFRRTTRDDKFWSPLSLLNFIQVYFFCKYIHYIHRNQ